jgi:hypothetical protein
MGNKTTSNLLGLLTATGAGGMILDGEAAPRTTEVGGIQSHVDFRVVFCAIVPKRLSPIRTKMGEAADARHLNFKDVTGSKMSISLELPSPQQFELFR